MSLRGATRRTSARPSAPGCCREPATVAQTEAHAADVRHGHRCGCGDGGGSGSPEPIRREDFGRKEAGGTTRRRRGERPGGGRDNSTDTEAQAETSRNLTCPRNGYQHSSCPAAHCLVPTKGTIQALFSSQKILQNFSIKALFSSKIFCKIDTVAFSFVFDKYCSIMD